jgi:hypothetical protein
VVRKILVLLTSLFFLLISISTVTAANGQSCVSAQLGQCKIACDTATEKVVSSDCGSSPIGGSAVCCVAKSVTANENTTGSVETNVTCEGDKTGINTAIGCIHVLGSPETFLADILRWAVGIGGGIAFLLTLYAGFMIMTGSGNPERLKAGQELLTSAVSGLILLIFSIFILNFIGIDILGLDIFGFGK